MPPYVEILSLGETDRPCHSREHDILVQGENCDVAAAAIGVVGVGEDVGDVDMLALVFAKEDHHLKSESFFNVNVRFYLR